MEKTNPNFRLIATMTEMPRSKKAWNGDTGRINKEMLSKYLNDLRGTDLLYRRSPRDGQSHEKDLVRSGVDEDDIRTDEFAGY